MLSPRDTVRESFNYNHPDADECSFVNQPTHCLCAAIVPSIKEKTYSTVTIPSLLNPVMSLLFCSSATPRCAHTCDLDFYFFSVHCVNIAQDDFVICILHYPD